MLGAATPFDFQDPPYGGEKAIEGARAHGQQLGPHVRLQGEIPMTFELGDQIPLIGRLVVVLGWVRLSKPLELSPAATARNSAALDEKYGTPPSICVGSGVFLYGCPTIFLCHSIGKFPDRVVLVMRGGVYDACAGH